MDERFFQAVQVLPQSLRDEALRLGDGLQQSAEEIRLRLGQRPKVIRGGEFFPFSRKTIDENDLAHLLQIATRVSPHRLTEDMKQGFLSLPGGHRLGICGAVSLREGEVINLSELSSACIRVARQFVGIAREHRGLLMDSEPRSVLIIAPPGAGKTTYLRDLVRLVSARFNVSLVDERGEVAAFSGGKATLDVGENTDVLTLCPKAKGIIMLLRAMAPRVIAVDEITAKEDVSAIMEAHGCGVKLIATAHARGYDDLLANSLYARLLEKGVFERLVTVSVKGGQRKYEVTKLDKTAGSNNYGGCDHLGRAWRGA